MLRAQHADRREHGPGARHEHKAKTDAKKECAAITDTAAAHEGERAFDQHPEARKHERGCQHEQHRDREVTKEVLRQSERRKQRTGRERERREAHDQTGDDRECAPISVSGSASREDDREHRQDARGEGRDHARDESDREQDDHRVSLERP